MFDLFNNFAEQNKQADASAVSSSQSSSSNYSNSSPAYSSPPSGKTFVLSVGGSVFFDEKPRTAMIGKFCEVINGLVNEGYSFVLVSGGGKACRMYLASAKALGANNFELDQVGIDFCRINARILTYGIERAWPDVLIEQNMAGRILSMGYVPIYGGAIPGQTSDANAALIAEYLGCEFINLSNVDGIYASDPAKVPGTKMFSELTHVKMMSLLKASASKPGAHTFIDPQAANILARSNIRGFFLNGNDFENFKSCIRGQPFKGTIVQTGSGEKVAREDRELSDELKENPLEDEEKALDPRDIDFR